MCIIVSLLPEHGHLSQSPSLSYCYRVVGSWIVPPAPPAMGKKKSQQQSASFRFKRAGRRVASGILLDKTLVYCVSGALRRSALMANDSLRFCLDFCSSGFSVRQRTTG